MSPDKGYAPPTGRCLGPLCQECGTVDTVEHLPECSAFASTKRRLWGGPLPSLEEVDLSRPVGKVMEYIQWAGRYQRLGLMRLRGACVSA